MHWSIVFIVLSIVHIGTVSGVCSIPDIDVCQFISCGNGTCIRDNSTDQCYRCQCDVGYSGLNCETEINIGNNNCGDPCQNGGRCESKGGNAFACVCPADFIGVHCEVSVIATHVCIQAPEAACQNGGVCTINGNDFLCRCAIGWTGRNCETAISTITPPTGSTTCPTNPCAIGAICLMTDNGFMCSCPPTYTGLLCDVPISSTTFSTTEPTTTNVPISTTTSGPGQSNSCASRPCLNDATCYNTGNSFFCFCKKGFSGPTCALQTPSTTAGPVTVPTTSPCASNPCNNGGSCYKFNDSFVCACTTYYTGDTCDQPKVFTTPASTTPNSAITCANGPCQNGGTCYSTGNSYFCFCGSNSMYTGKNCEQPKPTADATCPLDCSPGYCIRTGATENAYACMCNGALTPSSCRK